MVSTRFYSGKKKRAMPFAERTHGAHAAASCECVRDMCQHFSEEAATPVR